MKKTPKDQILLVRLAYFFKHFKPDQKKFMRTSVPAFLAEPKTRVTKSKKLSVLLDYFTDNIFRPIKGVKKSTIITRAQRRSKMRPSLLLLHSSAPEIQRRYCGYLGQKSKRVNRVKSR